MTVKVLIVDARPERSRALEHALRDAGFEVVTRADEHDDLYAIMTRVKPDAVIIDAALPSRDTLEHMGQLGRRFPKPMIMLAEEETPDLTREATSAGVSAYVVEDVQPALVRSMVNVAIASFEAHRALKGELTKTQTTLSQRRTIERAKSQLMEMHAFSEDAAYQWLRKRAMNRRLTIHEVAQAVLASDDVES
ncbi:ANTAR domain-containing protein [Chromohalobacter salexigens]|uniref:ANTAR domain-containing response regulator n=1 Tax=Chromohalobacter TaxID=42054 RepID=UPI00045CE891|nr:MULTISPECIES: ANTAR domain-containing protein [Chromohalobacter]MCK2041673.1 ANTAR domain-containing protein [Chromohalobacter moromii]MCT8513821.1 ANTAR domain-containing protein [Chromohalobacter sp. TMW 2.2271]NWO10875.1 ANTAR domain-containing protein [Chromohalobacter salexigens]CDQ33363.1 putative transcriptional regulatory protein pdtaR [Virgibacillus halodenitrificans]